MKRQPNITQCGERFRRTMLLNTKNGIKCDCCGTDAVEEFKYYSLDFNLNQQLVLSVDQCEICFAALSKQVGLNNKVNKCEITGQDFVGDTYCLTISKVIISFNRGKVICMNCKKSITNPPCTCGGNDYVKQADVIIDKDFTTLNICQDAYQTFQRNAESIRLTVPPK